MFEKYIIKENDSLESIANKFNTTVDELRDMNKDNFNDLSVGSQIVVPANKERYFEVYTIKQGDNLYQIGLKYNINPELLATLNGLNMSDYIYPNQEIIIPKANYSYYITKQGDTLDLVADTFKTSKENVLRQNQTIYLLENQLLVNKNQ